MTLIKICGLTRPEDAALAEELGADFLGFVFVKESPRYVTPEKSLECGRPARSGRDARAPRVGVFRGSSAEEIRDIAQRAQLDLIQIHDDQSCDIGLPVIRAYHVKDALPETADDDYVLFDTGGGTGRTFDWTLLEHYPRTKPFFLAGGLTPDNVADAIRVARPDAIDLSSGIESAPGIKDPHKMKTLFERVRR
jgi:phosphoribosylanthranilate isomerase